MKHLVRALSAAAAFSLIGGLAAAIPAADAAAARPAHSAVPAHFGITRFAASPAGASACPLGDVCVWDGINYTGSFYGIYGYDTNTTGIYDFTHAESVYNHGQYCVATVWTGTDFTGTPRSFARGTGLSSLQYTDAWHHIYSNSWGQCV